MKTLRLIIKGKVQGVFYRAFAKDKADQLGIKGWIKNLADRNVEMKVSSSDELLATFVSMCKEGPPRAIVDEVVIEEMPTEQFKDFRILR